MHDLFEQSANPIASFPRFEVYTAIFCPVNPIQFIYFCMQGLPSVCEFSTSQPFSKTNVAHSVAELMLYSLKHEMWLFSIKFGELRYKNRM